jgi:retron-type reverse transcriptase
MKTYNNLYEQICSYQNLWRSLKEAKKGRRTKDYIQQYEFNAENEITELRGELLAQTYQPGTYKEFYVLEPKKRMISAAPFRDRVVHHALCDIITPLFEKKFIFDSYANRVGKGTHAAVQRYHYFAKKNTYVLKCDIKKYFPSIDHQILKSTIRKTVSCQKTLWLIDKIIDNSNLQEPQNEYFVEDDLFTPYQRRRGLPIGNLTSQFFANVYLNELDHYIKEELQQKAYIRYVDDFVILGNNKAFLNVIKQKIGRYLTTLRLLLHANKSFVHKVNKGINFLGYKVFADYALLVNGNLVRFRKRMKSKQSEYNVGKISIAHLRSSIHGWLGYAKQCNSFLIRKNLLDEFVFSTG